MDKYKKHVDTITSQKNSNYTITISNVDNMKISVLDVTM